MNGSNPETPLPTVVSMPPVVVVEDDCHPTDYNPFHGMLPPALGKEIPLLLAQFKKTKELEQAYYIAHTSLCIEQEKYYATKRRIYQDNHLAPKQSKTEN